MRLLNGLVPLATLAVAVVLAVWIMPVIQAGAGGLAPFDARLGGYSLAEAQAYLAALTPQARAAYLGPYRVADTLFPVLWTLTLLLPLRGRGVIWMLPALVYGLTDLAEDWVVAGLLRAGTDPAPGAVALASSLTVVKFAAMALAVLVAGLALWSNRRRR